MELDLTLAAVRTAAGAAAASFMVAGVVQAVKAVAFPAVWQYGRAPMILAALLALALAIGATLDVGLSLADPSVLFSVVLVWLAVYTGAIGTHQTVSKAGRVVAGTTDPAGPDVGSPIA